MLKIMKLFEKETGLLRCCPDIRGTNFKGKRCCVWQQHLSSVYYEKSFSFLMWYTSCDDCKGASILYSNDKTRYHRALNALI